MYKISRSILALSKDDRFYCPIQPLDSPLDRVTNLESFCFGQDLAQPRNNLDLDSSFIHAG